MTTRAQASADHPVVAADITPMVDLQIDAQRLARGSEPTKRRVVIPKRGDGITGLKANGRMECLMAGENRRREQRRIDRRVETNVGIARMKPRDLLHRVGADRPDGAAEIQFLLDVAKQSLVARDDDVEEEDRKSTRLNSSHE